VHRRRRHGLQWSAAPYSQWGDDLDVVAPGGDLNADLDNDLVPDGILQQSIEHANPTKRRFILMQGTSSSAAAHASGVCVLIKSAFPNFHNAEIRSALENWCVDRGAPGKDLEYGFGLISAYDSLSHSGYPIVPQAPSHVTWSRVGSNSITAVMGPGVVQLDRVHDRAA
jgi:serine protease